MSLGRWLTPAAAAVVCWALAAPAVARAADVTVIKLGTEPAVLPGPPILHAPPARAPQLENAGVWRAQPILVSGTSTYRQGEFLYQDYLYDDHGARELPDPNDRRTNLTPKAGTPFNSSFSINNGTYTYPSASDYAENAADLVELRVKPLADSTAFRVTLHTMHDPKLVAFAIALGGTPGTLRPFPHGANVAAPADYFLTVHGSTTGMAAELVRAADGTAVAGPSPQVVVDLLRRQIEVRVPHAAWNPSGAVRMAAGVGLWDIANSRYLLPQSASSATVPGGAGLAPNPAAFFNIAFRYHERSCVVARPGAGCGPGQRRHQCLLRRGRRREAADRDHRRQRRPDRGTDVTHPGQPLRTPSGHRLRGELLLGGLQLPVPGPAAALHRLRSAQADATRRLRADPAAPRERNQLQ